MSPSDKALPVITAAAISIEESHAIPAELLIAQCALESTWLADSPGNNCFGIKAYPGCYGRQLLKTQEWFTDTERTTFLGLDPRRSAVLNRTQEWKISAKGRRLYDCKDFFATFPSIEACFLKRAELFSQGRYKPFMEQFRADGDKEKLIRGIGPIYATYDPPPGQPDYATIVLKIANQDNVKRAIHEAKVASLAARSVAPGVEEKGDAKGNL